MIFWLSLQRVASVMWVVARHAWDHLARPRKLGRPERLRAVLEDIGGTFIKFGQMLALQPDILPLEYCNALFNLLDRVAPFPFVDVERIFVEELGRRPSEIFDSFDPDPIATASIGQVHVAWLRGRKLAVKVQRPTVDTDFAGDVRLMTATIWLVRTARLRPLYWLIEPMSEFAAWTKEELDYRREARYMQRLHDNARDNENEQVPEVLWEYTTRRTLVAEFFDGQTALAYLRARETGDLAQLQRELDSGIEPSRVASNIIDNFLGDVFRHGMFHADLHPANLIILPGNVVGYIDFGITGTISRYSRQNLISLTLAYTRGDLEGMCESFFRVSAIDGNSDVKGFHEGLRRAAEGWYESDKKHRRLRKNLTLVMLDMLRLSRRTGIWPEKDVIKYIRSSIAIDGLITRFAPKFDVGRHLEMVCDRFLSWQVRRALFTYDTLAGWAGSSARMTRDGALRGAQFISRLSKGEIPARIEIEDGGQRSAAGLRGRATFLAGALFAVSLVVTASGQRVEWGVNLFMAEIVFLISATGMLLYTIRGLSKEG